MFKQRLIYILMLIFLVASTGVANISFLQSKEFELSELEKTIAAEVPEESVPEETPEIESDPSIEELFNSTMKQAENGDIGEAGIIAFLDELEVEERNKYWPLYQSQKEFIQRRRAENADNWLRIVVKDLQAHKKDPLPKVVFAAVKDSVQAQMHSKWNKRFGFKLVLNEAMSEAEEKNTWKTLTISINHRYARYSVVNNSRIEKSKLPIVPTRVEIAFKMAAKNETPTPTSWDIIPPIRVRSTPPTELWFENEEQVFDEHTFGKLQTRILDETLRSIIFELGYQYPTILRFEPHPKVG